jgi:hypothetical protein
LLNNLNHPQYKDFVNLFGPGDVPGYLTDGDMNAISFLSKKLPKAGLVVEVGSFLGKSAVEWAKHLPEHTILCLDSFNSPIEVLHKLMIESDFVVPPEPKNNLELFTFYTNAYQNIKPVKGFFNKNFAFPEPIDLVFEDSTHELSYLVHALPFWWQHIKTGGILSGHDYGDDVATAVDMFAALNNLTVQTFNYSSIWYIEK